MPNDKNWTRAQTIIALYLYHQIPISKNDKTHPLIVQAARHIDRSPSALSLKIANLAHLDPTHQKRHLSGLSNGSHLDQEIWDEFQGHYSQLLLAASEALEKYHAAALMDETEPYHLPSTPEKVRNKPADPKAVAQARGQNLFRNGVLSAYNNQCCMTGIAIPQLLTACHIIPIAKCENVEDTLNPQNGLCLNALCQRAFSSGLITVDCHSYTIAISPKLKEAADPTTQNWLVAREGQKIQMPSRDTPLTRCLEYHNDVIFQHG